MLKFKIKYCFSPRDTLNKRELNFKQKFKLLLLNLRFVNNHGAKLHKRIKFKSNFNTNQDIRRLYCMM